MFTSAAILLSYFGAERSGRGGGLLLILYMHMSGGGATGPQNAWGILRVK